MEWCLLQVYVDEGEVRSDDIQVGAGDDGNGAVDSERHCQRVCYSRATSPIARVPPMMHWSSIVMPRLLLPVFNPNLAWSS
jgi:hypothetical protein